MSTRSTLATIATILHDAGAGVYRATGAYAAGEVGIVIGLVPPNPDAIGLIPYPLSDDPTLSDSVLGVQVRLRRDSQDPRDVMDLSDAVFGALQNHPGSGLVLNAERVSGVPLGEDSSGRPEWSDNYQVTTHRPSTHRI